MYEYDIAIIGGGSAGLTAAKLAQALGKKTIIIEKNALGGDCLFYGCVPSKALISINKVLHSPFLDVLGIDKSNFPKVDFNKIKQNIESTIDTVGEGDSIDHIKSLGIEALIGCASFINQHTLQVDGKQITASRILIATGSRPFIPNIEGLSDIKYFTNESIFQLDELPKSMVVLGGGPIGCEMAQAFKYLGSDVTIVQRNEKLIPNDDSCASDFIQKQFKTDGIKVLLSKEIVKVSKVDQQTQITLKTGEILLTDLLLIAIGRKANLDSLNAEAISIKTNDKGVIINKYLQTSIPNVYAAGDVCGPFLFTHFAAQQASFAIVNMTIPPFLKQPFNFSTPWVTFVSPEIAHCGSTQQELNNQKIAFTTLELPYSKIDRAITDKSESGFIRIYKSTDDYILGATIIGERAGELIMECIIGMSQKIKISKLLTIIHPYPTYSSGLQVLMYEDYLKNNKLIKFIRKYL